MEYPEIAIQGLINSIENDKDAYKWLSEGKWKELAAFVDVVCYSNPSAIEFLIKNKNKYSTIVNFLAALQKEEKAFDLLMGGSDREWAATVNAIHGSADAYEWLLNNNFHIYAKLADTLIKSESTRYSGNGSYISEGGSFGGSGFGGFGGGGGSW